MKQNRRRTISRGIAEKPTYKLALLTGGSSGIGLALAFELVKAGTSVLLVARRPDVLAEASASLIRAASGGVRVRTLELDVSDPGAVEQSLTASLEEEGTPDLCINGAGIAYPHHFESISLEMFRQTMDVNLGGIWNILSIVIPLMKKAGGGTVLNVSSLGGLVGTYGYTAYSASKFAVMGFSQSLRNEMKPDGIDVRVLCPPDTDTPQLAQEELTKPAETRKITGNAGVMKPEIVARITLRALRGRRFIILPGFMSKVAWYAYRFSPGLVHFFLDNDVRSVRKHEISP